MPFFNDIDGNGILERNSHRLEGMEMRTATKLLKQFKIARSALKNRLLFAGDNTFTEAKLKNTLVQIEDALRMLKQQIDRDAQQSFTFFHEQAVEDGVREVSEFERKFAGVTQPLPIDKIIFSVEPENLLFNNFQSSLDAYSEGMRNKFQQTLTQSLLQNRTWTQAVADLDGVQDEWMLARIVRTELHGIYGMSKVNSFGQIQEEYLPDLKKTLYQPMDSRTGDDSIYASKKRMIVDVNEPFQYVYKGQHRVFMSPPDRPNDRSIVIPYRKAWDSQK